VYLIEAAYERVRADEFANKPSRLNCAFACGRPESAMFFALRYRNRDVRFYELRAIGTPWIADMSLLDPGPNFNVPMAQTVRTLFDQARRYWASVSTDLESNLDLPEILLPDSATVQRQLMPPFLR
jgi:hypothetical protein